VKTNPPEVVIASQNAQSCSLWDRVISNYFFSEIGPLVVNDGGVTSSFLAAQINLPFLKLGLTIRLPRGYRQLGTFGLQLEHR
jgi:hypothetical protein